MVDLARKILFHDKLRFLITMSGVAFAVMLVLVQMGLFVGLLDNATITIRNLDADIWVASKNTPNVDFANNFPDGLVQRVRSIPGVAKADNLIVAFMQITLPTGAKEGVMVYALEDFARWNFPWNVVQGNLTDMRRGDYFFLDESAAKRFGAFSVGDYRENFGSPHEDRRHYPRGALLHYHADCFYGFSSGSDYFRGLFFRTHGIHHRQVRTRHGCGSDAAGNT